MHVVMTTFGIAFEKTEPSLTSIGNRIEQLRCTLPWSVRQSLLERIRHDVIRQMDANFSLFSALTSGLDVPRVVWRNAACRSVSHHVKWASLLELRRGRLAVTAATSCVEAAAMRRRFHDTFSYAVGWCKGHILGHCYSNIDVKRVFPVLRKLTSTTATRQISIGRSDRERWFSRTVSNCNFGGTVEHASMNVMHGALANFTEITVRSGTWLLRLVSRSY